jgi:hypothetical protein
MDSAESIADTGMEAAYEPVQDASVISMSLYERVINILDNHVEYADRAASKGSSAEAA